MAQLKGDCDCCERKNVTLYFSPSDCNNSGSDTYYCNVCGGGDEDDEEEE